MKRVKIEVSGRVQGVGFRWWVMREADRHGVGGYAENLPDGRVEVVLQGEAAEVDSLTRQLIDPVVRGDRPGRITSHRVTQEPPRADALRFQVR